MAKHLISQRYVFKIHTSRLQRAKWDLQLSVSEARENKELIMLSESQLMRFIDELNGITNPELHISEIKSNIKKLRREKDLAFSRPKIKNLYAELDQFQFKNDYICVVIDSNKDYRQIYKNGFKINGITYRRLLGTTGGVKTSTIVFVNEKRLPDLKLRIDNGRDLNKEFTPAKLEAYFALVCSSSTPVSLPHGIAVVPDCRTHFKADVIELDDTGRKQPSMKFVKDRDCELIDSDGYGLAMPSLMKRWGAEIGEDFTLPGCVIRNAFCKGSVFPVDFQKFAREHNIAASTDSWGNPINWSEVELVLTESMLKLWDSYSSLDDYLNNCEKNHYTFAITKSSDETLESERTMNYQFLQSYPFTDEQIDELIEPTVNEINDILSDDYRKTLLYLKGMELNDRNIQHLDSSFSTALMIEPQMIQDPYVRNQLYTMIYKRINDAKVGVLSVPANYSLVSGDPYSLCQSMMGLKITGLLKAGEVYSKYWIDRNTNRIASFRAPMTSHNNIRLLHVVHSNEMDEFYKYMTTPTIFNSWDTCADAMNGMDKDGDCVINTAFPVLVNNAKPLPAILCTQRKSPKIVPSEVDLMESNISSFGNAVGEVTNKVTSMFEVQARFDPDSREYRMLDYRIKCGQLYQQNSIDKCKGIEAAPMPDQWSNWIANKTENCKDNKEKKEYWRNRAIAAEKKPYFMQYVYPAEQHKLKEYIKKNNEKCIMRFRVPLGELLSQPNHTDEEETFLRCYHRKMPLGTAPCTINRICWKIEKIFDGWPIGRDADFDYSILKCNVAYSSQMFNKIKKIYALYQWETASYMQYAKSERIKSDERQMQRYIFKTEFMRQCLKECPDEEILCDIVLDLCYQKSSHSKQFAWDVCGEMFIQNLLKRNHNMVTYPASDEDGDILFHGRRFCIKTVEIKTDKERYQ